MKKTCILSAVIVTMILLYFCFEPIITYNTGWKAFTLPEKIEPAIHHKDSISQKADSLLTKAFNLLETPALSAAVGMNNIVVWSNVIGYQHLEDTLKADLETKFRIGSTSKALTSIGLGVLLENKKLNLNSKVNDFVPYAKNSLGELTVLQLASHTSGIRNYGACFCFPVWEYYNNDHYINVKESVAIFNGNKLLFTPGTNFSYSSYNYTLLSAVMEKAADMDFLSFMEQSVFKPLGIKNIQAEDQRKELNNMSGFYEIKDGNYKKSFPVNNSNKWAGGGFIATPTDLVKLGNSFLNHTLLNQKTSKLLTTPVKLNDGIVNEQNYALGWRHTFTENVFDTKEKVEIIHHAGTATGNTSVFILFPEYNMSISVLINKSSSVSELFEFAYQLANLFARNG